MCVMLVQPAVCGIYDLPPLSSFFLFLFSSIEKRKSFLPRNGVFFSPLGRGGNVCAPHFFFSCERKRNVPRPVQRKRALGAAFVAKAAPFSYVSMSWWQYLGAMRTGFTFCAAAADRCAFPFIVHLNKMNKHSFPLYQDTLQKGKCRTVMFLLQ